MILWKASIPNLKEVFSIFIINYNLYQFSLSQFFFTRMCSTIP